MKNKILIILPSRCGSADRTKNVDRFIENWKLNTEGLSDICVAIDTDEHEKYTRHEGIIYDVNPNMKLGPKLNTVSAKYKDEYKYMAFFGDDHVIKTKWEKEIIDYFESKPMAMAYGNDLLQGERLPTAICLSSNIIDTLGYMVPTGLQHMFVDNFWLDIGKSLDMIKYFNDIVFEHLHPTNNKASIDSQYEKSNQLYNEDSIFYNNYINEDFKLDIKKLQDVLTK